MAAALGQPANCCEQASHTHNLFATGAHPSAPPPPVPTWFPRLSSQATGEGHTTATSFTMAATCRYDTRICKGGRRWEGGEGECVYVCVCVCVCARAFV